MRSSHIAARAVMPGAPAPNGKHLVRNRSAPASEPHDPMYRLKMAAMNTVSPGRMPMPYMMRAWLLAMVSQSARPMPKAVGRPVVPDVPCT
jgi:hypothetical protein